MSRSARKNAKAILDQVANVNDNVFLTATKGLLAIKQNNLEEGRRLYNSAYELATGKWLQGRVLQKKNLELAKYYIKNNQKEEAKDCLNKVIEVKIGDSVYAEQAEKLLKSLPS